MSNRAGLRGRRASRQDHLPAVARPRSLGNDARHLGRVDALGTDPNYRGVLGRKRIAFCRTRRASCDAGIRLARVRERLALSVLDIQQPLFSARLAKSERAPLAVVEDVRRFVNDEVGERIVLAEVVR